MSSSVGMIIPNIWKVIKFNGSKPPTSHIITLLQMPCVIASKTIAGNPKIIEGPTVSKAICHREGSDFPRFFAYRFDSIMSFKLVYHLSSLTSG